MNCDILIIEQQAVLRAAICAWIEAVFPDCTMLQSESAEEALQLVRDHMDLIVIADVNLPDMSGIELARRVSALNSQARIIIMSVQQDISYRTEAYNAGAVAYIPKDLVASDLIPTLQKFVPLEQISHGMF